MRIASADSGSCGVGVLVVRAGLIRDQQDYYHGSNDEGQSATANTQPGCHRQASAWGRCNMRPTAHRGHTAHRAAAAGMEVVGPYPGDAGLGMCGGYVAGGGGEACGYCGAAGIGAGVYAPPGCCGGWGVSEGGGAEVAGCPWPPGLRGGGGGGLLPGPGPPPKSDC